MMREKCLYMITFEAGSAKTVRVHQDQLRGFWNPLIAVAFQTWTRPVPGSRVESGSTWKAPQMLISVLLEGSIHCETGSLVCGKCNGLKEGHKTENADGNWIYDCKTWLGSTKCLGQSSLSALMFSSLSAGTAALRSATMKCVWQTRAVARDYESWQLARRLHTVPREDTKMTPVRQWGGGL